MVDVLLRHLTRWYRDERGQGMVEYGLIIALIAVALILTLGTLRDGLIATFCDISQRAFGRAC